MQRKPNLLYIHSDQHNPAVAGCYGDSLVKTPNLDDLAAEGTLFTNTYCPSPLCVPSRMSMLTGRFPHEIEVWTNNHILDSGIPTFAHAMGAAGYRPVLMGRMHSVGIDQLHGYTDRPIGDHGSNYPGHGRAPDNIKLSLENSGSGQSGYQVHDEDVTAATVDFLNRLGVRKRAGQPAEPFCLSVGFMLPHHPYLARGGDYSVYRECMALPSHPEAYSEELHPFLRWWRTWTKIQTVPEEEILRARTAYWALVARMDVMIGEILDALGRNDMKDDTLILYSSDHGDQVGEHGLWMKRTFYEGAVKVPAILTWPGRIPSGKRCDRIISSLDLNATMLDALDAPPLPGSHGRSLMGIISSEDAPWDDTVFSEYCMNEGWYCRMVRSSEWKLCYYHGHEPQLFNLEDDPHELTDRAGDPECRKIRKELTERIVAGWDPESVVEKMANKRRELGIIRDWAQKTEPPEQFRWNHRPEMTYRD